MAKNSSSIILVFALLCLYRVDSFSQVNLFDSLQLADFEQFDFDYNPTVEELISKINTTENYDSWVLKYKHADFNEETLIKKGKWRKHKNEINAITSNTGFFIACMPSLCYYYIVGFISGEQRLVDNKDRLTNFIGAIDNLEELELLARLNGYRVDRDTLQLGSYHETEQGFYLYLTRYQPNPEKFWSVRAFVSKNGRFEIIDEKLFRETERRITY